MVNDGIVWKRLFFQLVDVVQKEYAMDEGEIVGWATHEDGQHYPIHAPTGGGGKSANTKAENKSSGKEGKREKQEVRGKRAKKPELKGG